MALYHNTGDTGVLYALGIITYAIDFTGPSVLIMALQASANPVVFRESYQRTVSTELVGRILAASFISALGYIHNMDGFFYWAWAAMAVHIVSFNYFIRKPNIKLSTAQDSLTISVRIKQIQQGLQFCLKNSLVRVALILVLWMNTVKFLVEYIFYQGLSQAAYTKEELGSVVGYLTISTIVATLATQALIGSQLLMKLSLTLLLTIIPLGVLVFGSAALIWEPLVPLVIMMVFFQVAHRCIQLPVSRQCFVPVPRDQRKNINAIVMILSAVTGFMISGLMSLLKSSWDLPQFIIFTLFVGSLILLFISNLDSFYIKNLWSYYREKTSGEWLSQLPIDAVDDTDLSDAPFEDQEVLPEAKVTDENLVTSLQDPNTPLRTLSRFILLGYAHSYNLETLNVVVETHKKLLASGDPARIIVGLSLLAELTLPNAEFTFAQFMGHKDINVRRMSELYSQSSQLIDSFPLKSTTSYTRRKLRGLILDLLAEEAPLDNIARLRELVRQKGERWLAPVVELLTEERGKQIRHAVLSCVKYPKHDIFLTPLLSELKNKNFVEAQTALYAISKMGQAEHRVEVFIHMNKSLKRLLKNRFNLWKENSDVHLLEEFSIALHLEERMIAEDTVWNLVINTIKNLGHIDRSELPILVDMHLEYLKQSPIWAVWNCLMNQSSSEQNYLDSEKHLRHANATLVKVSGDSN